MNWLVRAGTKSYIVILFCFCFTKFQHNWKMTEWIQLFLFSILCSHLTSCCQIAWKWVIVLHITAWQCQSLTMSKHWLMCVFHVYLHPSSSWPLTLAYMMMWSYDIVDLDINVGDISLQLEIHLRCFPKPLDFPFTLRWLGLKINITLKKKKVWKENIIVTVCGPGHVM